MGFNDINKNSADEASHATAWDVSPDDSKNEDREKSAREQLEEAGLSESLLNSRPIQDLLNSEKIDSFEVTENGKNVKITEKTEIDHLGDGNSYTNSLDPEHAKIAEQRFRTTHDIFSHDDGITSDEQTR